MGRLLEGGWINVSKRKSPFDFTILHLTDLHFCPEMKFPWWARDKAWELTHKLKPDYLVVTGDLVDANCEDVPEALNWLISCYYGKRLIMIPGNHDAEDTETLRRLCYHELDRTTWLCNDYYDDPDSNGTFVGISCTRRKTDRKFFLENVVSKLIATRDICYLCHYPDHFELMPADSYELGLAGHTHHGQIVFPNLLAKIVDLLPNNNITGRLGLKRVKRSNILKGCKEINGNWSCVGGGLGTHPPGRFGCPLEIAYYG